MPLDAFDTLGDDALLQLYTCGDQDAARVLTTRLTPMVFSLALRLLNNQAEAEDVTQEAMMRLWKMAPKWREGEAKLSTWLYRVTQNLCIDRFRRTKGVGLDSIPDPADSTPGVEAKLQTVERAQALEIALQKLPVRQRMAVVLRHIEGLANPEIARVMDIGVEAVESLTARGKRGLAKLLTDQKEELGLD